MIIEYNENCFIDVEKIVAIDYIQKMVILPATNVQFPDDVFERILEAFVYQHKSYMYDFVDKESDTYHKRRPGNKVLNFYEIPKAPEPGSHIIHKNEKPKGE